MAKKGNKKFINRELSWIDFNDRVLQLASDKAVPLLERVKFLAITDSNLDEFFMVRVGGLRMIASSKGDKRDPSGFGVDQLLDAVSVAGHSMCEAQHACWRGMLEPKLAAHGIRCLSVENLDDGQLRHVERIFGSDLEPILTPIAVSIETQIPLLMNRSLHLAVRLKKAGRAASPQRFAVIPIPAGAGRFITLPADGGHHFVLVEDLVRHFASRFFPGETILECAAFRITRNADMNVHEDLASDLLSEMEAVLDARTRSDCVRLEIDDQVTARMLQFFHKVLAIGERETYKVPGPMNLSDLMQLSGLSGFDALTHEPWPPNQSLHALPNQSIFDQLMDSDRLMYHPYDSFDPVQRFIEAAAADPDVVAIKQVLYRTSRKSPIVAALMKAAESGKYVTALVELKARFDSTLR